MTTPNIPQWFQAAIAKLNEKYDEKRQQFKQQGNRYHDGFADGLEAAETIFMREFKNSVPKENDIAEIELHSSHVITLLQSLCNTLHNLAKEGEENSNLFKDIFEIFDFFVNDLDIEKSKYVQENQAANQFIADMKQVAHEIKNPTVKWERLTFTVSELLEMLEEAEPQSGWISVADRLPASRSQEVNVLLKTGEVRIALFEQWIPPGQTEPVHYFTGDIYHVDGHEYQCTVFDNDEITHWQPLPQPPKAK